MKTNEFLALLKENSDKSLVFEYAPGLLVGANYHITEVKNITIDSVDCGAGTDFWKETIIQLWESPQEIGKRDYMSAYKALAILNKVDKIKPMEKDVEVKFLVGCSAEEEENILRFVNQTDYQKALLIRRSNDVPNWALSD